MAKLSIAFGIILSACSALPVAALPVCYMEAASGEVIDLSYMCGNAQSTSQIAVSRTRSTDALIGSADVWAGTFRNTKVQNGELVETTKIRGNIYNSGPVPVETVEVQATGYSEGRNPQTQELTIDRIGTNQVEQIEFDFGFSVPVESWDIRILSWE